MRKLNAKMGKIWIFPWMRSIISTNTPSPRDEEDTPTVIHKWIRGSYCSMGSYSVSKVTIVGSEGETEQHKKKNFLAYHHFNPSLFESIKKWGSAKKFADKYRCQDQTFFGEDLFSHLSRRCCGLHTNECYLLPSYTKFGDAIKGAIEEKGKKKKDSTTRKENINHPQQECNNVPECMIAGKGQKQAQRNYIISKGGRKLSKEVFHINLANESHLARKVMETGPTRYKNLNKQVQIEWDSNNKIGWVDQSQMGNSVSKDGRGKRHRRTVEEARVAEKKGCRNITRRQKKIRNEK